MGSAWGLWEDVRTWCRVLGMSEVQGCQAGVAQVLEWKRWACICRRTGFISVVRGKMMFGEEWIHQAHLVNGQSNCGWHCLYCERSKHQAYSCCCLDCDRNALKLRPVDSSFIFKEQWALLIFLVHDFYSGSHCAYSGSHNADLRPTPGIPMALFWLPGPSEAAWFFLLPGLSRAQQEDLTALADDHGPYCSRSV